MCKYYICTCDSLFTILERGIFAHCNSAIEQRILTEEDVIVKESRLCGREGSKI